MTNELQLQGGAYKTTFVGTEIIRPSTKEEWKNYGHILRRVDEAKQWAIGDWLVDGKRHYGDKVYEEASKIVNLEEKYLSDLKRVSEKLEFPQRCGNLLWSHHKEVAYIYKSDIDKKGKAYVSDEPDYGKIHELLSHAEKEKWSVRDLREAVNTYKRRQQEDIRLANEPEKYPVIVCDPAWEYEFSRSNSRKIGNHYLPESLEDMKRLKIPAADDCVLFMWATIPKLPEALELINAWGFDYKTGAVWVKDKIGMGYYFRQKIELLLLATKGNLNLPDEDKRPESVFFAPRTEHSEKPDIAYEMIKTMYPGYKKLELNARKPREGFDVRGDELPESP